MSEKIPYSQLNNERKCQIVFESMGEDWHDTILADIFDELSDEGFPDAYIQYSGFYSQGDGASFTCDKIDLEKFFNSVVDIIKFTLFLWCNIARKIKNYLKWQK